MTQQTSMIGYNRRQFLSLSLSFLPSSDGLHPSTSDGLHPGRIQRFALRQAEHDEAKNIIEATQAFEPDQLEETTTQDDTSGDMETRLRQWPPVDFSHPLNGCVFQ